MNGLSSDYLENLAYLCLSKFNNVLPCNMLTDLNHGDRYICNLDKASEKGSHCVALSIKKNKILYFDSLGLPCMNEHIIKAFQNNNITEICYSEKPIQSGISFFYGIASFGSCICQTFA